MSVSDIRRKTECDRVLRGVRAFAREGGVYAASAARVVPSSGSVVVVPFSLMVEVVGVGRTDASVRKPWMLVDFPISGVEGF